MATQRIYVSGRVQAVGFRDWAVRRAGALGITGWVRNLRDGRVELLVAGSDDAVTALIESCREGPARAEVSNVEAFATEEKATKGFTKRFTV